MVEEKKDQALEPLSAEDFGAKSKAVKTDDERYVGVDPIYRQSAYEEPLEVEAEGRSKEAKEAVEDQLDMLARVKENEAGCVVNVDEPVPFEEWVGSSSGAARKAGVRGADADQAKADAKSTEDAKVDGKIPPHSGSVQQPGVHTAP